MRGIFIVSVMIFAFIFAFGDYVGFTGSASGTQPSVADLSSAGIKPADSAAIALENMASEDATDENEDMVPECVDGYVYFYGRQVWMTRDVPAVCGELRQEFSGWLASQSPLSNQGRSLSSAWSIFLAEKIRNESGAK